MTPEAGIGPLIPPPTIETVEDVPLGRQVDESFDCFLDGYNSYMTMPDGRIFCEGGRTFRVDDEMECTEVGGRVEYDDGGDIICHED